ncbi:MAG: hypothetical protein Q7S61_00485, partial [bacterium]|nr:hypothetical protein [bacterium]
MLLRDASRIVVDSLTTILESPDDKPRDPQNDGFYFMGKLNLKKGEFATIAIILAAGIYVIGSVLLSEVVKNRSTTSTA